MNEEDKYQKLKEVSFGKDLECLIPEDLWVVHWINPENEYWMHFEFYEFHSISMGEQEGEAKVECLMYGGGPIDVLRECRHTYWGKDGYIFYPRKVHIITMLEWLNKHYDLE